MPIRWKIVDDAVVYVAVTGAPTFDEFKTYIDEVTLAGGKSLGKLVDMRHATLDLHSFEIKALAAAVIAQAARADAALGPVAIVVDAESNLEFSLLFDDKTAGANRDLAVFADLKMALTWLKQAQRGI